MIDTRRNTQAGGSLSHLSNRKYICESCAVEMGEAMGQVSEEKYDEAIEAGRVLEAEVAELQGALELAQNEQHKVVSLADVVASLAVDSRTTKPPATRKPAAPKAAPDA